MGKVYTLHKHRWNWVAPPFFWLFGEWKCDCGNTRASALLELPEKDNVFSLDYFRMQKERAKCGTRS